MWTSSEDTISWSSKKEEDWTFGKKESKTQIEEMKQVESSGKTGQSYFGLYKQKHHITEYGADSLFQ